MNSYETISITHVRDRIKLFYDIQHTRDDMFIDLMIMDAVRQFNSYEYTIQDKATIDICDLSGDLPCNYKEMIAMVSNACDPCGQHFVYDNFIFDGNMCIGRDGKRFRIEQGKIFFPADFEGDSVDIYFIGYNTDNQGFPILKKSHVDYYFFYGLYWYGLRKNDPRYREFISKITGKPKYVTMRKNIAHNENVDEARLTGFVFPKEYINYGKCRNPYINFL
jgi:hypothetical protein